MGALIGGPCSGWLPGSTLCRGCQPLVGRAESGGSWLWNPGIPRDSGHPRAGACPLVDRSRPGDLAAGPRGPRTGIRPPVGGAGS